MQTSFALHYAAPPGGVECHGRGVGLSTSRVIDTTPCDKNILKLLCEGEYYCHHYIALLPNAQSFYLSTNIV